MMVCRMNDAIGFKMTPEQIDQMYALRGVLLDAIEAENDAMQKKISAQKQGGPVDDENI